MIKEVALEVRVKRDNRITSVTVQFSTLAEVVVFELDMVELAIPCDLGRLGIVFEDRSLYDGRFKLNHHIK